MSGGEKGGDDDELEAELDGELTDEELEGDELEDDELDDDAEKYREIDEALIDLDDEYDDPDEDDRPHSPHRYEE